MAEKNFGENWPLLANFADSLLTAANTLLELRHTRRKQHKRGEQQPTNERRDDETPTAAGDTPLDAERAAYDWLATVRT